VFSIRVRTNSIGLGSAASVVVRAAEMKYIYVSQNIISGPLPTWPARRTDGMLSSSCVPQVNLDK